MAPTIDRSLLHDLKVRVGRPISYIIPIKGEPTPTVTWTINGKPAVSKRMEITSTNSQTSLDIANSEREDSGKYTLTLQNTSGAVSATANVTVMGKYFFNYLFILRKRKLFLGFIILQEKKDANWDLADC